MSTPRKESNFTNHLPVIYVRGNNYEIGKHIGETFRERIQYYISNSKWLNEQILPYIETDHGKAMVHHYMDTCQQYFPQYMDEVHGIADGSQINFQTLFAMHLNCEINIQLMKNDEEMKGCPPHVEGCSTVLCNREDCVILAHNEDVPPECADIGYLVVAEITADSRNNKCAEKWVSFSNPGILVGNTFGFNQDGLAYTMNDIMQVDADMTGTIPRRFLMRSLINAKSVDDVVERFLKLPPVGAAFTINYAQRLSKDDPAVHGNRLATLEFYKSKVTVKDVKEGEIYLHTNLLSETSCGEYPNKSSSSRWTRFDEICHEGHPCQADDIINILSDRKNREFPIYRDGMSPDDLATTATALFDMSKQMMKIYRGMPSSTQSLITWPIMGNA